MIKLSDEIENRLQHLGYQNDVTAWEIGDLTEYIFRVMTTPEGQLVNPFSEEEVSAGEVYNTIAKYASKSPHAIRDYRYTSATVPQHLREDYHMLGRHHWKALIPHSDDESGLRWWANKILEWADDYNGQIITVAALRHKLDARANGETHKWERPHRLSRQHAERLLKYEGEDEPPAYIQLAARNYLEASET